MKRYFFNLFNDEETIDEEGQMFPDDDAAIACAKREVRNFAAESVSLYGHLILHHHMEVKTEQGVLVADISFGETIDVQE
jgi:hypothetical protein